MIRPANFRTSRRKLKPMCFWLVGVAFFGDIAGSGPRFALTAQAPLTKACNAPTLPVTGSAVQVSNEAELQAAMNNLQPGMTILIAQRPLRRNRTK
jgi:hypothetical protein